MWSEIHWDSEMWPPLHCELPCSIAEGDSVCMSKAGIVVLPRVVRVVVSSCSKTPREMNQRCLPRRRIECKPQL